MTVKIPLTQGQVATVCDCHAHLVKGEKWFAYYSISTKSYYAKRHARSLFGKRNMICMHNVIANTPAGLESDHKDRNTLNNQCSNLRIATQAQNRMNRGKFSNNTSGFKGVSWLKQNHKWTSQIGVNGKLKYIGSFDTPELAARAYDSKAKELFGEFASLNFPDE